MTGPVDPPLPGSVAGPLLPHRGGVWSTHPRTIAAVSGYVHQLNAWHRQVLKSQLHWQVAQRLCGPSICFGRYCCVRIHCESATPDSMVTATSTKPFFQVTCPCQPGPPAAGVCLPVKQQAHLQCVRSQLQLCVTSGALLRYVSCSATSCC
jgi:hypothetical protein